MAGVQPTAPRVLLVEDDKAIRDLVSFHLTVASFVTTTLAAGRDALEVVMREPFDVILLDVVLPGMDGITLCESIRHDGPNRDVPILMLTARREESDKRDAARWPFRCARTARPARGRRPRILP